MGEDDDDDEDEDDGRNRTKKGTNAPPNLARRLATADANLFSPPTSLMRNL
jgi:hypothetical protein